MNARLFPKLLEFLKEESDKVEFLKVCTEVGLGEMDLELAKLFLALQIYKSYYATIPREIRTSHRTALDEMRSLRDEVAAYATMAAANAAEVGQWAERITQSIKSIRPELVAQIVQKRLLEESLAALAGPVQALISANGRIDAVALKLNHASTLVETNIYHWQMVTMRGVWWSAFGLGFALGLAVCFGAFLLAHG
jgi:hypothetical protein